MMQQVVPTADLKDNVDFGIITIREDEFQAVLRRLPTQQIAKGKQTYSITTVQTCNNDEYVIASVRCPEQGNLQGQSVAQKLIDELNPQWILLVGIAGSVPDDEYTLGDVLLSSRLYDFCVSASLDNDQQQFSLRGGPMHPEVQSLLGALPLLEPYFENWNKPKKIIAERPVIKLSPDNFYGDEAWKRKVRECLKRYSGSKSLRNSPKVFTGSVASSDTLVKDPSLVRRWQQSARQISLIEMELAGVYQAAHDSQKPILAIRGISDIVGFKRSPEWTSYACNTAASLTVALLRTRPITPLASREIPHHKEEPVAISNKQVGIFKNKIPNPSPLAKREQLFSNLLEVSYYPEILYSIETSCKDAKEVWARLRSETHNPSGDWIYKGKTLYAFHDFSEPLWKKVCDENISEPHPVRHWANSTDKDRVAEFIELLKNCLKEFGICKDLRYIRKQKIKGAIKTFNYMYFTPTSEFSELPLLRPQDLSNIDAFVTRLKGKTSPFSEYIFANLSDETKRWVEGPLISDNRNFLTQLTNDLNRILITSFYDPKLFDGVHIRWEAMKFLEGDSLSESQLSNLNRMLIEDAYRELIARRTLVPRKVVIKSLVRPAPTEAFKAISTKSGKFSYYRHHAFRPQFVRIENKWFLEITPTYHYTMDGFRVSFFYEDLVTKIKRMERSGAVFRQVMFWARVLQDDRAVFLGQQAYPYLKFGDLLEFQLEYGINDDAWMNKELLDEFGNRTGKKNLHDPRTNRRKNVARTNNLFK